MSYICILGVPEEESQSNRIEEVLTFSEIQKDLKVCIESIHHLFKNINLEWPEIRPIPDKLQDLKFLKNLAQNKQVI